MSCPVNLTQAGETLCKCWRSGSCGDRLVLRITEVDADAIRTIFHEQGELSAAIELRRRFPGITDNAQARTFARTIAGWTPLPVAPCPVIRMRPRGTKAGGRHDPDAKD